MQSVPETMYHDMELIDKGIMPNPRMCVFTPTYKCNQRCYYCFYKEWNNRKGMEPDSFERIFAELKSIGVKAVEFEGGGDPLCTPNITDIFRKAAVGYGFNLGLLTNGELFTEDILRTYLKYGTYVRFSVDTVDAELYKQIRGGDFRTVSDNIAMALAIKRELKSHCDISVKIGVSKDIDYNKIHEVYDYFDGWGLDNIQVKNLWDETGTNYRSDINKNNLLRGKSTPVVRKVNYPKYMAEQCWLTPVHIAVDVFGDVYLCAYYMHNKEAMKIGNCLETPLKELWGSQRHREVIRGTRISDCLKNSCRFQKYMRVLRKAQKTGKWNFV